MRVSDAPEGGESAERTGTIPLWVRIAFYGALLFIIPLALAFGYGVVNGFIVESVGLRTE